MSPEASGVVDVQVHANQIVPRWQDVPFAEAVDGAIAAMDAVGVDAVLIAEYCGFDAAGHLLPGHLAPGDVWRYDHPFADEAVARHPERFAYVGRVEPDDPQVEQVIADLAAAPGCRALRFAPEGAAAAVARGAYDAVFDAAAAHRLPLFFRISEGPETLRPHLAKHPDLVVALDHTGVQFPAADDHSDRTARVQRVIDMADCPNLMIKWCHVERLAVERYPFGDVVPHLRRVVDAFGPERIMWGSDYTESRDPARSPRTCNWAEALYGIRACTALSAEEKELILGRTARKVLGWP